MKKWVIYFLLIFGHSFFAHGQSINSIENFRFMEGVWKGQGWIIEGKEKIFFKEIENVKFKLSNTALQIEAFGLEINDSTKIINNALGIMLKEKEKFKLHIYQKDGPMSVAEVRLNAINEMEWSLTISMKLKIKYIIKIEEDKWFETGFKSTDGIKWKQIFEMKLLKIK